MRRAKKLPDVNYLREILHYDPDTGDLRWKMKISRKVVVGAIAGTLNKKQNRWQIQIGGVIYKTARIVYYMHTGIEPLGEIDHKNNNPSDNRFDNLRDSTHSQNNMNKKVQSNNTSGFKGVSYHKTRGEFIAYAKLNGKTHYAGWHKTAESAGKAARELREKLHGGFVCHE